MTAPTQTPGSPLLETRPPCHPWCGKACPFCEDKGCPGCPWPATPRYCSLGCQAAGRPLCPPVASPGMPGVTCARFVEDDYAAGVCVTCGRYGADHVAASPVAGMPASEPYVEGPMPRQHNLPGGGLVYTEAPASQPQPAPKRSARVEQIVADEIQRWLSDNNDGRVYEDVSRGIANRVLREFVAGVNGRAQRGADYMLAFAEEQTAWLSGDAPGGGRK